MNNSTSSKSNSPLRERKRTPMACMNCRARKLKCRSLEPVEYAPCERCVKEGLYCEYRPVDQGPASNSQVHSIQDNSINLYPAPSAHPANHWPHQPNVPASTSGGFRPDYQYNPSAQVPLHANQSFYPTPQYGQIMPHSSYPAPQHTYPTTWPSAYPTGQPSYRPPPQFGSHPNPNQPMPYHAAAPAPSGYDQSRTYLDNYGNWQMDNSKPAKE